MCFEVFLFSPPKSLCTTALLGLQMSLLRSPCLFSAFGDAVHCCDDFTLGARSVNVSVANALFYLSGITGVGDI